MEARKCPKCGEKITRAWVNKKRGHQLVGYCPAEKKTVNLGKAQRSENESKPGAKAPAAQTKDGNKKCPAPASGASGRGPGPAPTGTGVPKRRRGWAAFREFLELD